MEFINEDISVYADAHASEESELLHKINRETNLEVLHPRMLSGHVQGRTLSAFSQMIKPRRILEIGTYTGYSALCLAEGLLPEGKLITIDINNELEERVRGYFAASPYDKKIDYRLGNALEIIPNLEETFDMVFIDADKINYSNYYDMIFDKLAVGGFVIADNVLWSGKVLFEDTKVDEDTRALKEFNDKIQNDPKVENVILPIRDGLMLARKI